MSKTSCPHCGVKLNSRVVLRVFDWTKPHANTGKTGNRKFDHDEAVRLFKGGVSQAAIGLQFDVSGEAVRQVLVKRGVLPQQKGGGENE